MTSIFCFLSLILITLAHCYIFNNLGKNLRTFTPADADKNDKRNIHYNEAQIGKIMKDALDIKSAREKAKAVKAARKKERDVKKPTHLWNAIKDSDEKQRYHLDPSLDMRRRSRKRKSSGSWTDTSSSSLELKNWKEEWKEHWLQKKFEAINSSIPKGDTVNMAAARPWGNPCGDPNQHDMPWGTCMLPMECEAEYRIYRGDYFCGRTQFICCALQLSTYDMYQGFDVSFADSSLETDSHEKRDRERGSKERRRRKRVRDQRRRKTERLKRKRKIKRNIRKIIKEIQKILSRSYRNGTTERKRKTRQLKKFIKVLKKRYKEERKAVKDVHEMQLIKIDAALQQRLNQIKHLNTQFIKNSTFRDIVVNGTITKKDARMLIEAYPELAPYLQTRRSGGGPPRDYLDYDIEYGFLYY